MGQRRAGPFKRLALIQVGVYYKYPVILDRKNAIIEYRSSSDTSGLGIEGGIKESAGKVSRNVFLNF